MITILAISELVRKNPEAMRVLVDSMEDSIKRPVPEQMVGLGVECAYRLGRLEATVKEMRGQLDAAALRRAAS